MTTKRRIKKSEAEQLFNAIRETERIRHPGGQVPTSIAKTLLREIRRLESERDLFRSLYEFSVYGGS